MNDIFLQSCDWAQLDRWESVERNVVVCPQVCEQRRGAHMDGAGMTLLHIVAHRKSTREVQRLSSCSRIKQAYVT